MHLFVEEVSKITRIEKILLMLLFVFSIGICTKIEIIGCDSGTELWKCEQNKPCVCIIQGCVSGNLMVYKDNIYNVLCLPSIINNLSIIQWDLCGNPIGEIKIKAFCSEGISLENNVVVFIQETTTTTTLYMTTTTTTLCADVEESCETRRCCYGLICCDDYVCREYCESERKNEGINILLILVPIIGVLIVFVSFIIIKKRGDIE